jgi:hypothetical protein
VSRHIKGRARGHGFSLLAENDKDVKTVQSLTRHANSNITMHIYTHAVSSKKRQAQSKVVEMIRGSQKRQSRRKSLSVYFLVYRATSGSHERTERKFRIVLPQSRIEALRDGR